MTTRKGDPNRTPGSHTSKPNYIKNAGGGRKFTPDRWEVFFHNLARTGLLGRSARAADASPETIRAYRRDDPEFAEMFAQALADYRESLEAEVHRRAVDGWDEPVYQRGELVGTIRRHSDRMLELLIKKNIPEYREKLAVDATVRGGVMVVPTAAPDADTWEAEFGDKARGAPRAVKEE